MKVLVDTSVWSLALRRDGDTLSEEERRFVDELRSIVEDGRVVMLGVIRQVLLSGIKGDKTFQRLENALEPFEDYPLTTADHVRAARLSNLARNNGVIVSKISALVAAVALNNQLPVFTTDKDFQHLTAVAEIPLHVPQA